MDHEKSSCSYLLDRLKPYDNAGSAQERGSISSILKEQFITEANADFFFLNLKKAVFIQVE